MNTEELIRAAVARCDRIVDGIEELRPFLDSALPVNNDDFRNLDVIQRIASIALLKRYEQLQDMLGRLFRAYLSWEAEDVREMTRRDQANQLEKFGIVEDADEWVDATALRNRLVHEYPLEEAEQVELVNHCWARIFRLIDIYRTLCIHLRARGISL